MALNKYNAKRIVGSYVGTVGGRDFAVQFSGFMKDTFMTAEYDEDHVTKMIGADGTVTAVLNANLGAKIVIMIVQGSQTNDELTTLVPRADLDYFPVGKLSLQDLNGTMLVEALEAWILKTAKIELGAEAKGREWTFDTGLAEINVGASEQ